MRLGIIGLGRMGTGIARRLASGGHEVVGFDTDDQALAKLRAEDRDLLPAASIPDLVARLHSQATVWIMVPCGAPVDETIRALLDCPSPPTTIIDGGNSNYRDSIRRHRDLEPRGIQLIDVGTSGGIRGESAGYCLMIGGQTAAVERLRPVFETLAPATERGWGHVGPPGSGHFVKMIHNGIEYGMMQALAEGFAVLERREDFELDLARIAGIWNEGSVIRSWLLELAQTVFSHNPSLEGVRSRVDDSGEGRWTVAEAIELNVATPVIAHSLMARIQSRDPDAFSHRVLSALRHEFGGHASDAESG